MGEALSQVEQIATAAFTPIVAPFAGNKISKSIEKKRRAGENVLHKQADQAVAQKIELKQRETQDTFEKDSITTRDNQRREQRKKTAGKQGRAGTILGGSDTAPAGTGAKTLLGS